MLDRRLSVLGNLWYGSPEARSEVLRFKPRAVSRLSWRGSSSLKARLQFAPLQRRYAKLKTILQIQLFLIRHVIVPNAVSDVDETTREAQDTPVVTTESSRSVSETTQQPVVKPKKSKHSKLNKNDVPPPVLAATSSPIASEEPTASSNASGDWLIKWKFHLGINDETVDAGEGCTDKFKNCHLVVQARLCKLKYYLVSCCASCSKPKTWAPYQTHTPSQSGSVVYKFTSVRLYWKLPALLLIEIFASVCIESDSSFLSFSSDVWPPHSHFILNPSGPMNKIGGSGKPRLFHQLTARFDLDEEV